MLTGVIDNSEVAYCLLGRTIQCRSNDLPHGTGIPLTSSLLFAFSFSVFPVTQLITLARIKKLEIQ